MNELVLLIAEEASRDLGVGSHDKASISARYRSEITSFMWY